MGCGSTLGFLPDKLRISSLQQQTDSIWMTPGGDRYRLCRNSIQHGVCNWMIPEASPEAFCLSCACNLTIPDLQHPENVDLWHEIEIAKRRLIYSLLRFGLHFHGDALGTPALRFEFLADTAPTFQDSGRVMTGHQNGRITLNIAEADPVLRETMREEMDEPYRTLLGHFRHESGHYFWQRFGRSPAFLEAFRHQFGDERQDYQDALARHHQQGPAGNWRDAHISPYASSHPWEDWAESWAHYLHMVDSLDTASQFGIRIRPRVGRQLPVDPPEGFNPYTHPSFEELIDHWFPLTHAMNSLNRSMGLPDAYPFVLPETVLGKLRFIHQQIRNPQ